MLYFSNKSKSYTFGFTFFIAIDMKYDYTFPLAINTGLKEINNLNKKLISFVKALQINQWFLVQDYNPIPNNCRYLFHPYKKIFHD